MFSQYPVMSEQIDQLATALAKAQGSVKGARKDSTNPHFKNDYADLASVWDACRGSLTANGLSIVQTTEATDGSLVTVTTTLLHASGQWMRGWLSMKPSKTDPQGIGSCITYARRYALAAMVGVAPEDDDGNAASTKPAPHAVGAAVATEEPKGYRDWRDGLADVAEEGTARLHDAWKQSKPEFRAHLTATDNVWWESLKKHAAKQEPRTKVPA